MAILMSVAMPVWRHEARREKEAELVLRGEQYARAIALFRAKNRRTANIASTEHRRAGQRRFLRKKYKDPMTEGRRVRPSRCQSGPAVRRACRPSDRTRPRVVGNGAAARPVSPVAVLAALPGCAARARRRRFESYSGRDSLQSVGCSLYQRSAAGRRHADGGSPDGRGNNPDSPNVRKPRIPGFRPPWRRSARNAVPAATRLAASTILRSARHPSAAGAAGRGQRLRRSQRWTGRTWSRVRSLHAGF